MFRKLILGTSAVFALWTVLDIFFHGLILGEYYKATAHLWRPAEEAKRNLDSVVVMISSLMFTLIYCLLVRPKSIRIGLIYGTLFGVISGMVMGYGSYAFMPVPYLMALIWFVTGLVQGVAGGVAVGLLIKDDLTTRMPDRELTY